MNRHPRPWPSSRPLWRRKGWKATLLFISLALALLWRLSETPGPEPIPSEKYRVSEVSDGDTFTLSNGESVRLLYIDTPERGKFLADSATALLTELVLGEIVTLDFAKRRRDRYGRLLASAFIGRVNVAEALLSNGYAHIYLFKDNVKSSSLRDQWEGLLEAQKQAIREGRGLWAYERYQETGYFTTQSSLRFHRPSCSAVKNKPTTDLRRFSDWKEPLFEGLSPCRTCSP